MGNSIPMEIQSFKKGWIWEINCTYYDNQSDEMTKVKRLRKNSDQAPICSFCNTTHGSVVFVNHREDAAICDKCLPFIMKKVTETLHDNLCELEDMEKLIHHFETTGN